MIYPNIPLLLNLTDCFQFFTLTNYATIRILEHVVLNSVAFIYVIQNCVVFLSQMIKHFKCNRYCQVTF